MHADIFATTAVDFKATGIANVFVNRYMALWDYSTTPLSDNRVQFCYGLSIFYLLLKIEKMTTRAHHPQTNRETEDDNHTVAIVIAVAVNERGNCWNARLPHVEFADDNSVNQPTGLAPNEGYIGRMPRLPLSVFDHLSVGRHQLLDRDQVA